MPDTKRPAACTLRFLGAAGTVTGSRFLIKTPACTTMIDCGLFQGLKELRLRNWQPLPLAPNEPGSVILTHAHLDHSGYLPALCRDGFRGRILATHGTQALCGIVLPDSGHLQEEEAEYANRAGYSRHSPALPLYTEEDARQSLARFAPVPFDAPIEAGAGLRATFRHAGHILGAGDRSSSKSTASTDAGFCSAATWAGPVIRCCSRLKHRPLATRSWSNRPTAIGSTTMRNRSISLTRRSPGLRRAGA